MKDIILIQPKAGSFDMLGARCPLALLSLAAIPDKKGYNVKIIDQRINHDWKNELLNSLKKDPICVGITCMTGKQILYALEVSKIVKEESQVPVIWGGIHPTTLPEQTLQNPYIDILVLREGEITFMELIEALEKKSSLKNVKGIYYKENGKIIKNPEREFIKNLDELPDLPYKLVDVKKYSSLDIEGSSLDFSSSRGCPYRCSFCYNTYFNKNTWRPFSAKETVKRLKNLVDKYKIRTIYFQDDNFCADLNRLKEILIGIKREKIDIKWGTLGLRVDTAKRMDAEILKLMEETGCINVDIGIESGSERILKMIDKRINIEDAIKVNRKMSKFPFIIKYTFIIGFPTETREEIFQTVKTSIKLAKENKRAYTPLSIYTPYPRTPMYDLAIKEGFVPPKSLEEWGKFNLDNWHLSFKSWLSQKQIRYLDSIGLSSLFANKNIRYKINKRLTKILFNMYHPIADFRFKNNFHFLPLESLLYKRISGFKID